jgi:hypothetical protein
MRIDGRHPVADPPGIGPGRAQGGSRTGPAAPALDPGEGRRKIKARVAVQHPPASGGVQPAPLLPSRVRPALSIMA